MDSLIFLFLTSSVWNQPFIIQGNLIDIEHDFSRPWTTLDPLPSYTDEVRLRQLFDIVQPTEGYPQFMLQRKPGANCTPEEEQRCGGAGTCVINHIPYNISSLIVKPLFTNQAHYRCLCENDVIPIDKLTRLHHGVGNITLRMDAECPKQSPCEECDPEHTIKCLEMDETRAMCICDSKFTEESNCKREKNGCIEPHPVATLVGNVACRVHQNNNTCIPIPQSLMYMCLCREPDREDRRLSFPNCMENRTECTKPLCLGFQPTPSNRIPGPTIILDQTPVRGLPDGLGVGKCNETRCQCPHGWLGPHCSEKRGEAVLGSWSPWTTCSPDCTMPRQRVYQTSSDSLRIESPYSTPMGYRSRFARCSLDEWAFCVGTYRFWRRCRVSSLCKSWTSNRLSSLVNRAISEAILKHEELHSVDRLEPLEVNAAKLTSSENHQLNFIFAASALILSCCTIWTLEFYRLVAPGNH